jgi:hypothetical protein
LVFFAFAREEHWLPRIEEYSRKLSCSRARNNAKGEESLTGDAEGSKFGGEDNEREEDLWP